MSLSSDLKNTVQDAKLEYASQAVFFETPCSSKPRDARRINHAELARHAFLERLPESFDSPHDAIRAGYATLTDWCELLEAYRNHHFRAELEGETDTNPLVTEPNNTPLARDPPRPLTRRREMPPKRSRRPRPSPHPRKGAA